jgi:hypothetical protein
MLLTSKRNTREKYQKREIPDALLFWVRYGDWVIESLASYQQFPVVGD